MKPRHQHDSTRSPISAVLRAMTALLAASTGVQALTGGQHCTTTMCVNAIVGAEAGKTTFQLHSNFGFTKLGWMAVGFGNQMPNTPMVITWPNVDGTITVSQREAPAHVMPTVVENPLEVAALAWQNSILATNSTTIAFTYPTPSNLNAVEMIWAYSLTRPSSAAVDAMLQQHTDMGTFTIDLTQPESALPTGTLVTTVVGSSTRVVGSIPSATPNPNSVNGGPGALNADNIPLSSEQKKIRAHGILMSVGFLILLPFGIFIARFSRTIPFLQRKWFTAHWIVQLVISAPIIIIGWVIGYHHVQREGGGHFRDRHTRIGLALLLLYLLQILWGTIIHFFKPKPKPLPPVATDAEKSTGPSASTSAPMPHGSPTSSTTAAEPRHQPVALSLDYTPSKIPCQNRYPAISGRPLQNYGHAINGLVIIALAFHNVREGYHFEWETTFGLSYDSYTFLRHLNAWWISWVIIVPSIYVLGLTLLPRQWRQESDARRQIAADSQAIRVPPLQPTS